MSPSPSRLAAVELIAEGDRHIAAQRVRYRAEIRRLLDVALEPRLVESRHACAHGELDGGYAGRAVDLVERAGGGDRQALGRCLVLAQHQRERHREAAGL